MTERIDNNANRRAEADPEDLSARVTEVLRKARIEGSAAYLDFLGDRQLWNRCTDTIQDLSIAELSKRLQGQFEWLESRVFIGPGEGALAHRLAVFRHHASGLIFHLIPGGAFTMGSLNEEEDEKPAHIAVVKAFLLGRHPVRRSIWFRSVEGGVDNGNLVQDGVSWLAAKAWLSDLGDGLRLPSEAEWEYACRACGKETSTRYYWGNLFDPQQCWSHNNTDWLDNCPDVTRHYKDGKWNNFGLVDMCGTIWEWCEDHWKNHYEDGPYTEGARRTEGRSHVLRGGSWYNHGSSCRSGYRIAHAEDFDSDYLGLRVARSLDIVIGAE
ncbi:MAG: SUMF1/EgtB/PvdO family nonheme iron enzyme [Planctomycetota bacterium]|nr:SUMF1/EgtB/PvdO family nonheme iron enzyme [Planctomycetota bacterium]